MTLVDNENGGDIINPYITIYSPDRTKWAALNTETFRNAQDEVIHPLEERTTMMFAGQGSNLYPVVATVAKQNHPLESELSARGRTVRTEGASDALALIPLGFLPEDVVRTNFPATFRYFNSKK